MRHLLIGYLDPGAGSMFLQVILAGALGVSLTIKTYWKRIISFFRRDKNGGGATADLPPTEDPR